MLLDTDLFQTCARLVGQLSAPEPIEGASPIEKAHVEEDFMQSHLTALVPMQLARKQQLITYLASVTRAVVFGTLLTGLLQGALVGIGFGIVHLPSPLVFAVIAALLSLLPVGGTALVWVPAALYLLAQGRYGAAIFLTIWGALLVGLMSSANCCRFSA